MPFVGHVLAITGVYDTRILLRRDMVALVITGAACTLHQTHWRGDVEGLAAVGALPESRAAGEGYRITALVDYTCRLVASMEVRPEFAVSFIECVAFANGQPHIGNINHPFGFAIPEIFECRMCLSKGWGNEH